MERARSLKGRRHLVYRVIECAGGECDKPVPPTVVREVCRDSQLLNASAIIVAETRPQFLHPSELRGVPPSLCRRLSVALRFKPSQVIPPSQPPPPGLEVRVLEPGDPRIPEYAREVQRRSWGFYAPPPPGVYLVAAFLDDRVVGGAYYNPVSGNVDYGVHVVRELWGRGVGSRVFMGVARLADGLGAGGFSVVRVLRGRPVARSDERALLFYLARGPVSGLLVCEAGCG